MAVKEITHGYLAVTVSRKNMLYFSISRERKHVSYLSKMMWTQTVWQHWLQMSLYSLSNYNLQNKLVKGLSVLGTLGAGEKKKFFFFFFPFCLTWEFLVILNMLKGCNICTIVLTVSVTCYQSPILLLSNGTQDKIRVMHFMSVIFTEFTENYFVK